MSNFIHETLGRLPPLPREEEIELIKRGQAGDIKARDHVVLSNARFVIMLANRYVKYNDPCFDDCIIAGMDGMYKAFERFEPERNLKFISYAVWWIMQAIQRYLEDDTLIHVPTNQVLKNRRYRRKNKNKIASGLLPEDLDYMPRLVPIEIKQEGGEYLDNREVAAKLNSDETSQEIAEKLAHLERSRVLNSMLRALPKRHEHIMRLYYGIDCEPLTLKEIGDGLGLSRERIRQIITGARAKMKAKSLLMNKKEYMDLLT